MFSFIVFLILVAIALFVVSRRLVINTTSGYGRDEQTRRNTTPNTILRWSSFGVFFLAIVMLIFSCFVVIEPGQVGVKVLFGQTDNEYLHNGLSFINPLYSVHKINAQTQEYTMSYVVKEGRVNGDDAITVQSKDNLDIKMEVTVWWRINPGDIVAVYNNTGMDYEEKIVRPAIRSVIRDIAAQFPAMELCSTERGTYVSAATKALEELLKTRGMVLERFLLRNSDPPENVKVSIQKKITAEQEAQQMVYVLQKEKQEAERKRIEAQGIQDFQKIVQQGITKDLLTWKGMEVAKELIHSQNSKLVFFGYQGNPFVLNGGF